MERERWCRISLDAPKAVAQPGLAYIMFTSGSSGIPKGVLIEHAALATTILENGRQLDYAVGTRTLSFAAYTFDVNVMEIFLTLLHGGCLFIPDANQRLGNLARYINEKDIEMALMTPTAVRNLLQAPSQVPSLKTLRIGGEPLPQSTLQQWSRCLRLINSYGPTESCVDACRNAHISSATDPNNIGYPIGTHLWVVEPENYGKLAPIGCPGELFISGPTLARGYLDDEERTLRAFIDGSTFPWRLNGETRFYATGDIVRQNSDGSISFVGRRDLQTKLNGVRIELEEVEAALERCEDIVAAVVEKVSSHDSDSECLVAFFMMAGTEPRDGLEQLLAPTDDARILIQNVSARAAGILPAYMVPQFYLPMYKIPLTASGKVNRSALRRIFEGCSLDHIASYRYCSAQKRPTRTTVQKILQGLWAQTLNLTPSEIGLDNDFISLGGESLAAIKLATMCREIGFDLKIADILRRPRLEDMALHVEDSRSSSSSSIEVLDVSHARPNDTSGNSDWTLGENSQLAGACGLEETDIEDVYPCTPVQKALVAVTARIPQSYIAHERFRMPASVDLKRFKAAWELVHENNAILRTRICSRTTSRGVETVQVVCRRRCEWIETADSSNAHVDMGLGTSLVRYRILESQESSVFEMWKHHSIYDGFSVKLIWDDLIHAYTTLERPQPRPSYRQYVNYLYSLDKEQVMKFWKEYLQAYQGEHFPTLRSPDYVPQATSKFCHTVEARFQWNKSCPFTFGTIAQAAWAIISSTRGKSCDSARDICFITTLSGRDAPLAGLDNITGPTINTVPIRVKLDLDQPINQYLRQIHENLISMLHFEHFGLSQICRIGEAARHACKSPTLLMVQPAQLQAVLPLGLTRLDEGQELIETFGLVIECVQSSAQDTISLFASHDPTLMAEGELRHTLRQFLDVIIYLNCWCNSDSPVYSAISSLANEQSLHQMIEWNRHSSLSSSECLHQLVEESAKRHPHHIAIDAHDGQLTYEELDAAADSLAAALQDNYNIAPGDLVPLCFEKSSYMIVAILGILKSGAGYTPLDVSHPSARLEHIIHESRARLVVVSALQAATHSFSVPTFILNLKLLPTPSKGMKRLSASPKDVAYVTFTSGSSGPPKGVITEHGASSLSVQEHGKRYQHARHGTSLRALQFSSYTFDASVLDIFATLDYGGCLCIPSEQERMGNLEEVLARMKINFADLTPTVANLLEPSKMPTLKGLAIGGEMASRAVIKKWTSTGSPLETFINSYGPTEASIGCAAGPVDPKLPVGHVGKAVGASLWIVDEANHNQLVPISCVGELVISGPTLARGYLNDSERTKASFVEDVAWLARTGEKRLYKTGDLARFDVDGNVEILGRKEDGQIKLHGTRLELGEIEAAIGACESLSIVQRVSVAKVNVNGNPTLTAFIQLPIPEDQVTPDLHGSVFDVPSERSRAIAKTAVDALRRELPEYMVPKLWMPVCSWPLTVSNKTDRKFLTAACEALDPTVTNEYQKHFSASAGNGEPISVTETEGVIRDAWMQVLQKGKDATIEPRDDFFQLGGDSLGAIMLISALRSRHVHITAHEIFRTRSLRKMAELIDSRAAMDINRETTMPKSSSKRTADSKSTDSSHSEHYPFPPAVSDGGSSTASTNLNPDSTTSYSLTVKQPFTAFIDEEKRLRCWWASVLGRPEHTFFEHDNFFSCGGDALAVLRLSNIASVANVRLSGAAIYLHPTLFQMTNFLCYDTQNQSTRLADEPNLTLDIGRSPCSLLAGHPDIEDVLPASCMQLSFLIEGQKWCRTYYVWSFIEIDGSTISRVRIACKIIADRHPILRTSFHLMGRQCYQSIRRDACDFKVLFHYGFPDQMCERLDTDVEHPVSFGKVLTRFRLLIEVGSGRQVLALGLSHAQYDGFCIPVILKDLRLSLMGEVLAKRSSPSYHQFIQHTLELSNEDTDRFWRETLENCRITSIVPVAHLSQTVMDCSIIRVIPFKFKHLGQISYSVMLKVAWALVLSRLSQSTDVTFGNLVSGRFAAFEGAQDVIGPCLNLIPARVRIDSGQCYRDLLKQVHDQQVAAIPFESTPFDRIARQAAWPATMHFASIFQYQNLPNEDTLDTRLSNPIASTVVGNAVYGGGLLQHGGCWLMGWPVADGRAGFRFTFSGDTFSSSAAESILSLLFKTLHAINDNLEDQVRSVLSFPISEELSKRSDQSPTSQKESPNPRPSTFNVPASCNEVIENLKVIWAQVLQPMTTASRERIIDRDGTDFDQNDSFFELGGDSISAAEAAYLCMSSGFDLKLQDFIDFPTLGLQALLVSGQLQRPRRDSPGLHFKADHKFN